MVMLWDEKTFKKLMNYPPKPRIAAMFLTVLSELMRHMIYEVLLSEINKAEYIGTDKDIVDCLCYFTARSLTFTNEEFERTINIFDNKNESYLLIRNFITDFTMASCNDREQYESISISNDSRVVFHQMMATLYFLSKKEYIFDISIKHREAFQAFNRFSHLLVSAAVAAFSRQESNFLEDKTRQILKKASQEQKNVVLAYAQVISNGNAIGYRGN